MSQIKAQAGPKFGPGSPVRYVSELELTRREASELMQRREETHPSTERHRSLDMVSSRQMIQTHAGHAKCIETMLKKQR